MWRRMAHDEPTATESAIFRFSDTLLPLFLSPDLGFPFVYPSGTNEVPCTAEVVQPACLPLFLGEDRDPPNPYNDVNDKSRAHVKNLS